MNYFELIPGKIFHNMITLEYNENKSEEESVHFIAEETGPYEFVFRLDKIENKFRAYYVHEGFEGVDYVLPMSKKVYQEAIEENTIPFWIDDDIKTFDTPEEAVENLYHCLENNLIID